MAIAARLMSIEQIDRNWHGVEAAAKHNGQGIQSVVRSVQSDSPAARSGLRSGDVIVSVAKTPVVWPLDVERALLGRKSGDEASVVIERDGKTLTLALTLEHAPGVSTGMDDKSWDLLGVKVEPMPATEFSQLRTRYRGGLRVVEVRPRSPAASQGIRPGDVLVGMHIWETISLENLAYVLSVPDFEQLQPIKFYIVRNNETLYGHLRVATKP
jgi:serine protease Do